MTISHGIIFSVSSYFAKRLTAPAHLGEHAILTIMLYARLVPSGVFFFLEIHSNHALTTKHFIYHCFLEKNDVTVMLEVMKNLNPNYCNIGNDLYTF